MIFKLKIPPAVHNMIDLIREKWKVIAIIIGVLITLLLSLSASMGIFSRYLGDGFGYDMNPIHFIRYAPYALASSQKSHWIFSLLAPFGVIVFLIAAAFKAPQSTLFGNAHWATLWEAKKAGLLADDGIILGKKWGKYLCVAGFEHVFVFAPSGSGKTTSLVIPNLLAWKGSCIVQDIKGGIFETTSGFRAKYGQACYLWNPGTRDGHTHAYNPIDSVSRDPVLRVDDLQKIANILIPENPRANDPLWTSAPRQLFVALQLYLLDTPACKKTLGEMVRLIKNTPNFQEWIEKTLESREDLDPLCYRNFFQFLQSDLKLQASILQSFLSYFELFDNPLMDSATSHSDFDITQLRKKPMTIYVAAGSDNLSRLSPLLTVFYQQVMDHLLRQVPDIKKEPHGVLMLLDEFSALKRMDILQKSIGLMREYRVRVMAIIQDIPQLNVTYGQDGAKAFINSKYRVLFAQNDLQSAQLVSGWLGYRTVEQKSQTSQSQGGFFNGSESTSVTKQPLKSPDEIMKLPYEKMIIAVEGGSPVLAKKNFWFKDPALKNRNIGSIDLPVLKPVIVPFDRDGMKAMIASKREKNNLKTDEAREAYLAGD